MSVIDCWCLLLFYCLALGTPESPSCGQTQNLSKSSEQDQTVSLGNTPPTASQMVPPSSTSPGRDGTITHTGRWIMMCPVYQICSYLFIQSIGHLEFIGKKNHLFILPKQFNLFCIAHYYKFTSEGFTICTRRHPWPLTLHRVRRNRNNPFTWKKVKNPSGEQQRTPLQDGQHNICHVTRRNHYRVTTHSVSMTECMNSW